MEGPAKRAITPTSGKKRKRPASISPRKGKKRLSLSEVRKHVNSATASQPTKRDDAGTSSKNPPRSIESFFAKAKPPRYTPCPVCSEEIKLSEINRHLDSGCLSKQESPAKGEEESVKQSSRKVADVRNDVKDKRTRRRLQNKFESSPLYQQSSSSLSSDDNQEICVQNHGLKGSEIPETLGKEISISHVLNHSECADQDSEDAFVQSSDTSMPEKQNKRDNCKARSRLSLKKLRQRKSDSESNFESEEVHDVTKDAIRTESHSQSKKVTSPFFNHARKGSANIKSPGSAVRSSGQSEGTLSQNLHYASSDDAVESFRITPTRIYIPEKKSSQSTLNSVSPETKASTSSTSSQQGGSRNKISLTGSPSTSTGHDRGSRKIHRTPVRTKLFSDSGKPQVEPLPTQTSRFSKDYVSKGHRQSPSGALSTSSPIVDVGKGLTDGPGASSSLPSIPTSANGSFTSTPKSSSIEINKGLSSSNGESAATSSLSTFHSSTPKKGSPYTSPAKSGTTATSPARSDTLGSPHKPREPYYIVNFKLILNAVLKNEFDAHLFDDEDHAQVSKFNSLSGPAQQLYVRLFQRKFTWFRVAKVDYPKISLNLKPLFTEMINAGLLITESSLDDLAVTLKLLMAPDLKQLAKDFKVGGSGQKGDMVDAIIKYSSRQRSFFSANMDKIVLKKAKKLLGSCVKLTKEPRAVFNRIIMLFSLVRQDLIEEEKGSSGQSALQTELLVNMGRMSYPAYTVFRTRSFFASREDLLRYEVAMHYENDIADALGINDFELADRLQATAMVTYKELAKDEQILKHDETLPEYLRCYSAGWVYTHVGYQGVEIRQKQRRYEEAVELLRALLEQKVYCPDRRGGWYDRLALNLDQHCKKQHEALDCIKDGMADPKVRVGHRLALQLRAQKILKSNKKQLSERADEFQFDDVLETPKVTIQGTVLPHHGPGVRNTFISSYQGPLETDEGIVVCSVEQVALEHYKQQGYTEGIHGEGTTYSTLIFVIFWDIVFHPNIPDVFCYPFQTAPLDLRTDHFYTNRCDAIQRKLDEVREADEEQLATMLETNWMEYEGDLCVGLSWEIFRDVEHAKGLLRCIGGKLLSAIAERILTNHRHCRAGRPDLTMWNPETKKFKLVEVKGPGDRLSQKQILWIDFFLRHGIEAEVCHVEAIGSKRLKRKVHGSQSTNDTSSQDSVVTVE